MTATVSDGSEYSLTFANVTFNADAAIAAANEFNSLPDAGMQYLTVDETFTNTGTTGTVDPGADSVGIAFITPDGSTYAGGHAFAVTPNAITGAAEVPVGGKVTGTAVYEVPIGTTQGSFTEDNIFIAAQ
jgi:hypothetical protein